MTSPTHFRITPPDARLMWGTAVLVVAVTAGLLAWQGISPLNAWPAALMVLLVLGLLVLSARRREVTLDDGVLRIAAGIHTVRIPVSELDVAHARVVNLETDAESQLGTRTFGTRMPGLRSGHFRLRNGGRAFALVTELSRALHLPQRDGRVLLLSLDAPQALIAALECGEVAR